MAINIFTGATGVHNTPGTNNTESMTQNFVWNNIHGLRLEVLRTVKTLQYGNYAFCIGVYNNLFTLPIEQHKQKWPTLQIV